MSKLAESILRAHQEAVAREDDGYIDPETGFFVIASLYKSPMLRMLTVCILALSLQGPAGCTPKRPQPRLVMLNVFCTLGKDMLQPYDGSVEYTPNLRQFAEQSVVFDRHMTEAGQSGVAFASIISGEHAMRHLVYSHPTRLPDEVQTLPEAFAEAGYDTFFWDAQSMASLDLNYGQGVPPTQAFHRRQLRADDPQFQAILQRLEDDPNYKAFVLSFYSLTHSLYSRATVGRFCAEHPAHCEGIDPEKAAPFYEDGRRMTYNFPSAVEKYDLKDERLQELVDAVEMIYKSRVYYTDAVFGRLVKAVDDHGLGQQSLIAFTTDHGETLYREDSLFKWSHSFDLAHDVMNVPLILRGPGIAPGRYAGVSGSADVFPTLAGLSRVPIQNGQATFGSDLAKTLDDTQPSKRVVFTHTGLWPPVSKRWWMRQPHLLKFHPSYDPSAIWASARAHDLIVKYRYDGAGRFVYEAFDLATDPKETRNILDPENPSQKELLEQLDRYRKILIESHVEPAREPPEGSQPDEDTLMKQLRALGYID